MRGRKVGAISYEVAGMRRKAGRCSLLQISGGGGELALSRGGGGKGEGGMVVILFVVFLGKGEVGSPH